MYNLNQIEATMKHGKINIKSQIILKLFIILLSILSAFVLISGIIIKALNEINNQEFIITIVIFILTIIIIIIFTYLFMINKKCLNEISEWLKDAVICKAKVNRVDFTNMNSQPYQIEVNFEFNNKKIKKISKKFNLLKVGLPKIFAKYDNKIINILYSEKYDAVLFVKNK